MILPQVKRTSRRSTELSMRYHRRQVFIGRLCPRLFVNTCDCNVSRDAVHRSWQTRTAMLAWSALSFCFRSSRSLPLSLFFFTDEKMFSVASPDNRQNKVSGRLQELLKKRLSIFFSAGTVRSAAAWPPVNCVCVPQLLQQLINTTLCPAFLRKFFCQPLCCVPLQIQTFFIKILSSSLNTMFIVDKHCSDVCCDEFLVPQIDRKSKQ